MIQLLKMSPSGDAALVVRGHLVMSGEPGLDNTTQIESAAEELAVALEQPLAVTELQTPAKEEWTWAEVLQTLNSP
ncbi:MAG: hypothetical protein O9327_01940 [Polaromonas sp.]|nr:hypothetical protein [Polaromonas sp.]